MFNLTVYCRRTLNTIPPEGGAVRPVNSSPEPAVRFRFRLQQSHRHGCRCCSRR